LVKHVYLPVSEEFIKALGCTSNDDALEMIIHIGKHDPKARIDHFLRGSSAATYESISALIGKMGSEGMIKTAPFQGTALETLYCVDHDGCWILDARLSPREITSSLAWLACKRLGVPDELIRDLQVQLEAESQASL
jgi:hypothetical protein